MTHLERIDGDLYDITTRLKEIDERYEVFRNRKLHRFEIRANGVLQIAVPYERLDERTIRLARETRLENMQSLISRIDKQNSALDDRKRRDMIEKCLSAEV